MSAGAASTSTERGPRSKVDAQVALAQRRRWTRVLLATLIPLALLAVLLPIAELDFGTTRARACVAAYEGPRGVALPDCRAEMPWFVIPSRVPWTATTARYRAEELQARIAMMAYTDALVGHPDPAAIAPAANALENAAQTLRKGSQRLALEELGHTIGAPNLGRAAALYGDRATLLARFDRWETWDQRLHALEAALIEGDLPRASEIGRRYAAFDPRDEDLRTAVGALLCLNTPSDAKRGLELLTLVQDDRAMHRHEAWARNWGELRAVIVACALRAGLTPPPRPARSDAGQSDAEEVRAALRLRVANREGALTAASERRAASLAAIELLGNPRSPGARVRLLAAVLASGHTLDATTAAELSRPALDAGEPPVLPSPARIALDWLDERCVDEGPSLHRVERCPGPRALWPAVSATTLLEGAAALETLANESSLATADVDALRAASSAARIFATQAFSGAGDPDAALDAIARGSDHAFPGEAAKALARSNVFYLSGQPERALEALDDAPTNPEAFPESRAIAAAILVQRAQLLAAAGKQDESARIAVLADKAAETEGSRALRIHARWSRVALARSPATAIRIASSTAPADACSWPWVGVAGTSASWLSPAAEGPALLDRALEFWANAAFTSPENRRSLRHAALHHRGDAPIALTAYFTLAASLVQAGEGSVELWLDVFTATDARRFPLRSYAWMRAESARMRGDQASAALWTKRRRALVAIVADPVSAEIARYLGL